MHGARMPQTTTRNKNRKRQTKRRQPRAGGIKVAGALKEKRITEKQRKTAAGSRVSAWPEEERRSRNVPSAAHRRAKSPQIGRVKGARSAKRHRAISGRPEL